MYPTSLNVEDLVLDYHKIKSEFEELKNIKDDVEKSVLLMAIKIREAILSHPSQMSWPLKEAELKAENVPKCIPNIVKVFTRGLFHGRAQVESETLKTIQKRNSLSQDMVYMVTGGRVRTPKSVLFPSVVKALCNKLEVIRFINNFGHGICNDLIREIDTEHALLMIMQQEGNHVLIPEEDELKHVAPIAI